jgi:hypothetical protein
MKTGAGRVSLIAAFGGLGNMANIPGSETITTAIAIALANNPKVSQVVGMVSGTAVVGTAIGGAEAAAAKTAGGAAIRAEETSAAGAAAGIGRGTAAEREASIKPGGERTGREISPEELGEKPEMMTELQRKLLEETPSDKGNEKNDEEDESGVYVDGTEVDLRNV